MSKTIRARDLLRIYAYGIGPSKGRLPGYEDYGVPPPPYYTHDFPPPYRVPPNVSMFVAPQIAEIINELRQCILTLGRNYNNYPTEQTKQTAQLIIGIAQHIIREFQNQNHDLLLERIPAYLERLDEFAPRYQSDNDIMRQARRDYERVHNAVHRLVNIVQNYV